MLLVSRRNIAQTLNLVVLSCAKVWDVCIRGYWGRVLWLYKAGINEEQQGRDILPLCDAAEINNRTTHSLWVVTDLTTCWETGKHTENSCKLSKSTETNTSPPPPPNRFKVFSLLHLIKKKINNFPVMKVLIPHHKELFNPIVKHIVRLSGWNYL